MRRLESGFSGSRSVAVPISDQVIVITGASSGIGLATAREAARRGARVVLAARNVPALERIAGEIREAGGTAIAVGTDVTDYDQVVALARRAVEEYGRIDTWVNNAAVSLYATFRDISLEDFRRVLDVNLMGQIHGAKAALPYLEESAGALICIGSVESDRGVPMQSAYAASKHALDGWADALRAELAKERSPVRVTMIKPAAINTPIFEHAKSQLGVTPKAFPPVYAPELVVDAILHAAENHDREIYVGTAARILAWMDRINPRLGDALFRLAGYRFQVTDHPKSPDEGHNLYAPLPGGSVRGTTARWELKLSLYPWVQEHDAAVPLAAAAAMALGALALRRASSGSAVAAGILGAGALILAANGTLAAARIGEPGA